MTECVIFKLHKYLTHSPEKRHKELDKVHDIVVLGEGDLKKEKEWEMTVGRNRTLNLNQVFEAFSVTSNLFLNVNTVYKISL